MKKTKNITDLITSTIPAICEIEVFGETLRLKSRALFSVAIASFTQQSLGLINNSGILQQALTDGKMEPEMMEYHLSHQITSEDAMDYLLTNWVANLDLYYMDISTEIRDLAIGTMIMGDEQTRNTKMLNIENSIKALIAEEDLTEEEALQTLESTKTTIISNLFTVAVESMKEEVDINLQ